jgi:hypothetical protein
VTISIVDVLGSGIRTNKFVTTKTGGNLLQNKSCIDRDSFKAV